MSDSAIWHSLRFRNSFTCDFGTGVRKLSACPATIAVRKRRFLITRCGEGIRTRSAEGRSHRGSESNSNQEHHDPKPVEQIASVGLVSEESSHQPRHAERRYSPRQHFRTDCAKGIAQDKSRNPASACSNGDPPAYLLCVASHRIVHDPIDVCQGQCSSGKSDREPYRPSFSVESSAAWSTPVSGEWFAEESAISTRGERPHLLVCPYVNFPSSDARGWGS